MIQKKQTSQLVISQVGINLKYFWVVHLCALASKRCLLDSSAVGADNSSAAQVDIITQQPRSSQHTIQPGDSVDLSASSEQGGGGGGASASDTPESPNDEEDMLSRSSSCGANITPETVEDATAENPAQEGRPVGGSGAPPGAYDHSLPPSDSSQTTTEGPDSAVTPSDVAELVSLVVQFGLLGRYKSN